MPYAKVRVAVDLSETSTFSAVESSSSTETVAAAADPQVFLVTTPNSGNPLNLRLPAIYGTVNKTVTIIVENLSTVAGNTVLVSGKLTYGPGSLYAAYIPIAAEGINVAVIPGASTNLAGYATAIASVVGPALCRVTVIG